MVSTTLHLALLILTGLQLNSVCQAQATNLLRNPDANAESAFWRANGEATIEQGRHKRRPDIPRATGDEDTRHRACTHCASGACSTPSSPVVTGTGDFEVDNLQTVGLVQHDSIT